MTTGAKIGLYVGIPLVIIGIFYVIFFVLPKNKSSERIAQIDNTIRTQRLTSTQIQNLLNEKMALQSIR